MLRGASTPRHRAGKAILIAIRGPGTNKQLKEIPGVYEDVERFRKFLINKGLDTDSIVVLTDHPDTPADRQPVRRNIIELLQRVFHADDQEDTDYYFFYAGHGGQIKSPPCLERYEKDGLSEYILPSDAVDGANRIMDQELYDLIIRPLTAKSKATLLAIIDSCHSETMLNLPHTACNIWSWSSLMRRAFRRATETAHNILHKHDGCDEQDPPQTEVMHRPFSKVLGKAPEGNKFCEGNCCRKRGPRLLCLSSCRDDEQTLDISDTPSMTQMLLDFLATDSNPKLCDLMTHLSDECEKKITDYNQCIEETLAKYRAIADELDGQPPMDIELDSLMSALKELQLGRVFHPRISSYVRENMSKRLFP